MRRRRINSFATETVMRPSRRSVAEEQTGERRISVGGPAASFVQSIKVNLQFNNSNRRNNAFNIAMASLYISDIFLIFHKYEPSRIKLWEIIRTYNIIDMAAFLYLLENVQKSKKCKTIELAETEYEPGGFVFTLSGNFSQPYETIAMGFEKAERDFQIDKPIIRFDRVVAEENFNLLSPPPDKVIATDKTTMHIQKIYRVPNAMDTKIIDMMNYICDKKNKKLRENIYTKIFEHNLGTFAYAQFSRQIEYLLFPDNLHNDRNVNTETKTNKMSMVMKFIQFANMYMNFDKQTFDSYDPRGFRFVIVPKPIRIYEKPDCVNAKEGNFLLQPLYHGLHVIVYCKKNETRCYNRYGELLPNFIYKTTFDMNATFEAVILPIDKKGNVRSWRYWQFRHDFVIIPVDIFRHDQRILLNLPFEERLTYLKCITGDKIKSNVFLSREKNCEKFSITNKTLKEKNIDDFRCANAYDDGSNEIDNKVLNEDDEYLMNYYNVSVSSNWNKLEQDIMKRRDVYDPIAGIILRKRNELNLRTYEYRFNITFAFDLQEMTPINLMNLKKEDAIHYYMHYNPEMSEKRTICIVYGHDDNYYYICVYNRTLHQFIHAGRITRLPYDVDEPHYKSESIYVINHKTQCRGIFYLRVYYKRNHNYKIISYETKLTTSKFDLPFTNPLFSSNNTCG